ncbi:MAG: VOC family protein [Promethearchaeota archaeon]|nr:MAG: VOC family protein [Candidatus Lokiarchaeota archaeon]
MPRVIHFEIGFDNLERVKKFYEKTFNWKFEKWEFEDSEYWLINTGEDPEPGINGGLFKKQKNDPTIRNTIDVPNIDEFIKKIKKNGGKMATPKMPVFGVGWLAYFYDTEGNMTGIMQSDVNAK